MLALDLSKGDAGTLNPKVQFINFKLGKTNLDLQEPLLNWVLNQVINIYKVIFEQLINVIGWPWLSVSSGPVINAILSNYVSNIPISIPEIQKQDVFSFDYRIT